MIHVDEVQYKKILLLLKVYLRFSLCSLTLDRQLFFFLICHILSLMSYKLWIYCTVTESKMSKTWLVEVFLPSAAVAHSTMGRWITGPPTLSSYSSVCTSSFWPPAWSICSIPLSDLSFLCSLSTLIRDAKQRQQACKATLAAQTHFAKQRSAQ